MSSSSPSRAEGWPAAFAVLLIVICGVLWLRTAPAAAAQAEVVSVLASPADREVSLVTDVRPVFSEPLPAEAFAVTAGSTRLRARVTPMMSDRLAVAMVLDSSAAGASSLQAALNGAADFLLQAPVGVRVAAVADTEPPEVLATAEAGPKNALRALSAIQPTGKRSTADAVKLALSQLPPPAAGEPRLVLLTTNGAGAGGEPASALAERLRRARAALAVVTTSRDTRYWSEVTRDTGGVLMTAQPSTVASAFDAVADTLRARYLVTFSRTEHLPASALVQVNTPDGPVSARAYLPTASWDSADPKSGGSGLSAVLLLGGALVLLVGTVLWLAGRAASRTAGRGTQAADAFSDERSGLENRQRHEDTDRERSPGSRVPVVRPLRPRATPESTAAEATAKRPASTEPKAEAAAGAGAGAAAGEPERSGQHSAARAETGAPRAGAGTGAPAGPGTAGPGTAGPGAAGPAVAGPPAAASAAAGSAAEDEATLDSALYTYLDAMVGNTAAELADERTDKQRAVAKIALAAAGRPDLLDRVAENERRIAGSRFSDWPPTALTLDLIASARQVATGAVALVGPAGVRVQQVITTAEDGTHRPVLRLTRDSKPVCDCPSALELAQHVDLASLVADEPGRQ